jgi:CHAD domain-containing protein
MPYAFALTDRSLEAGLHRIAHEELSRALRHLDTAQALEGAAVHDLRKSVKKLRGALRLVRHGMRDVQAAENIVLRDAGRLLSGSRDGAVRWTTFQRLVGDQPGPEMAALSNHLAKGVEAVAAPPPPGLRQTFADMLGRVEDWRLHGSDRRILSEGLAETRARARQRMLAARDGADQQAIHDWRKRAKDHWYQARLLAPIWPEAMKPVVAAADRLGEALGDHHDLDMLLVYLIDLSADLAPPEVVENLTTRARDARQALETQSFALGARLFAGDPEAMADLWARWYKLWRAERPET